LTSQDLELVLLFRKALGLENSIGKKARGYSTEKKYYVVQFSDVLFYRFLVDIGITPRKSKTLARIGIPNVNFYDFLRGCIDGDGTISTFQHPESKNPQLRIRLYSASESFLEWIQSVTTQDGIKGFISKSGKIHCLAYAIRDSLKLLPLLYPPDCRFFLQRKYSKIAQYSSARV
jgi:hypothetical protein